MPKSFEDFEAEVGWEAQDSNLYEVTVRFIIKASDIEEAEDNLKDLIEQGSLSLIDNEDKEVLYDYDIDNTEESDGEL